MNIDIDYLTKELAKRYSGYQEIGRYEIKSERGPYRFSFEFMDEIEGIQILIQVALPRFFPLQLPHFFLKNPKQLGFIPHLEKDGYICYTFEKGLLFDTTNPIGIINEMSKHVVQTLKNGILKLNEEDFYQDFEVLWLRQSNITSIDSFIEPNNIFQEVSVFEDKRKTKKILINKKSESQKKIVSSLYGKEVTNVFDEVPGIYIPFRNGTFIKPPSFYQFWSIKKLRSYIYNNISGSIKRKLNSYLKSTSVHTKDRLYLFFSIPFQKEVIFVGVYFENKYKALSKKISHPLKKNEHSFFINPVAVKRHNKDYLLKRTLGNMDISKKNIAVIGLGSLGSPIVFELAKAGVNSLFLIDHDRLDVDNIYRHALGANMLYHKVENSGYYSISKAEAMVMSLNQMYPAVEVDYERADILEVIDESFQKLIEMDLIIVAIGEPTIELYLNERIYRKSSTPPVIYSWIEPLGIGGHSILTNNDKEGCLQCLFTSPNEPNTIVSNRSSFVMPNQNVRRTMLGCGSAFTPYGSIDAVQTAILTTRLAIQVLRSEVKKNPLKSWKGFADDLHATGLENSPRYEQSLEQLLEGQYLYVTGNCPVCGGV